MPGGSGAGRAPIDRFTYDPADPVCTNQPDRGRYHHGDRCTEPLVPGTVYRFEIDLWATACLFPKGHALRLEVSSSNFSRFDRNRSGVTARAARGRN